MLANANSMSANDTPNFPSPTASQADDSSAEMDFTASPENNHNTPTPESTWSTVGTSRKPASTARPRTELISVGIQLPPGTLTPKLPLYDLLAAIISAAHLSSKTSAEITLQAKPAQSLADDSSAEMDFTASPENNHNTPTPESTWSTVGTSRKPASTARPRTELISVGIQLPPGTLTPKLPLYDLLAAIISAAHLSSKTSAEITLKAKPAQSLVFLKTQSPLTAHLLLSLTHLQLNGTKSALAPTLAKALTQGTPSEVFDKLASLYLPPPLTPSYPAYSGDPNLDLDRPFTLRELEAALASNASRSAPGEDAITYTTLRNLPDHAKEFILQTFNKAWDSGCLPSSWTSSLISMIPKPGKPPSLSNLRPISLTSCVGKTLERMALTRLSDFLEVREFFPHSLIGFRRRVCAQDMFLILQHTFFSPTPSQIHALVTVDVRKAFDGVCHDHILSQLSSLGCGNRLYSYIRSFLSNRVARFRVDTHLSDPHVLTRGTPQGINGNELAHQLARDASNRAPLIPWPKPSEDGGRLSLRRTIKEVYFQLRLDKRLYPPPHPSLTVPEARLLRHIQMNPLITPSPLDEAPTCLPKVKKMAVNFWIL
ncbi:uncharacterized protein LOC119449223 [Dermacentor silvarum]|uniref:uncharacterized protein LOC119449223 n=1 Tax=Dermacentor silvarum TaxID=543639 RepID=UPI00189C3917|nr:uncharacterized protein LOC119449223 [Dermacentor silvarum]